MSTQTNELQLEMLLGQSRSQLGIVDPPGLARRNKAGRPNSGWTGAAWIFIGTSLLSAAAILWMTMQPSVVMTDFRFHCIFVLVAAQIAVLIGLYLNVTSILESSTSIPRIERSERPGRPVEAQSLRASVGPVPSSPLPAAGVAASEPALRSRGRIGEREYRAFADGIIEVDTLLGRRRFASMELACEFVGGVAEALPARN